MPRNQKLSASVPCRGVLFGAAAVQSPLIAAPRLLKIVKVLGLNIGKVKLVGMKSNIVKAKNYLRSSSRVKCTDSSLVPQPTCYWKSDGDPV